MSLSAADFSSTLWTISRWTSSGMRGPPPGVARVAIELYGMALPCLRVRQSRKEARSPSVLQVLAMGKPLQIRDAVVCLVAVAMIRLVALGSLTQEGFCDKLVDIRPQTTRSIT